LGLIYGLLVGAIAYFIYSSDLGILFALVVGIAVWVAMAIASAIGVIGPIVLERIGIDPATAVGPMVTTTTDLVGITVYFVLAVNILLRVM